MALAPSETFGGVVSGFVTDLDGRLIVTSSPAETVFGEIVPGYLTDLDGRLVVSYGS